MSVEPLRWCALLPVKRLPLAKSRLAGAYAAARADLALAFALDTAAALLTCPRVTRVVVVTDDRLAAASLSELGAVVVGDEPDAGLNPALRHAAAAARQLAPGCGLVALSADLPALRPAEVSSLLDRAAGVPAGFVRDAAGTGTTAVTAAGGTLLHPGFGPESAAAHLAAGQVELDAGDLPGLRRDVDTAADLDAARALGVGPHTCAVLGLDRSGDRLG